MFFFCFCFVLLLLLLFLFSDKLTDAFFHKPAPWVYNKQFHLANIFLMW